MWIIAVVIVICFIVVLWGTQKAKAVSREEQAKKEAQVVNEVEALKKKLREIRQKADGLKQESVTDDSVKEIVSECDKLQSSLKEKGKALKDEGEGIKYDELRDNIKKMENGLKEVKDKVTKFISVPRQEPSYTILNIPFLPDVKPMIDYSWSLYVGYFLEDSTKECFPILRAPRNKCPIKYPVVGRVNNRGASEEYFCNKIVELKLQEHFYDNLSLFVKTASYPYEPDLAYIDEAKGIFLDIEIDEPYSGWEGQPIHFKTSSGRTIDDQRNQYFTERGWTVIRFSEEQIRKQTLSCIKYIFVILNRMNKNIEIPSSLEAVSDLKEINWWSKRDAEQKKREKEREKLLGISKFNMPAKSILKQFKDYEAGKFVEDEIIKYKDDSCWNECKGKNDFGRYRTLFPNGRHIPELRQIEDDKLWGECKNQKNYNRYLKSSQIRSHAEEAVALQQEKEKQEEQRRQAIKEEEERLARETQRLAAERRAQELRAMDEQRRAYESQKAEEERRAREQEAQRLEAERRRQEARREEERKRELEAQRYERQNVTTATPPVRTPSTRGYA